MLRPFFSFYGSKFNMAARLGPPQRDHVIEPFAGSAGYSCRWEPRYVSLVEIDPIICAVWGYLIKAKPADIMKLQTDINHVDELKGACQEEKWLIGFWMNCGSSAPGKTRSKWGVHNQDRTCNVWSGATRRRIASQVDRIRHWTIKWGKYDTAPDIEAHWHIDPPYIEAGKHYRYNNIDYKALAKFCTTRDGFVHVCEASGADWLPFVSFATTKGTEGKHRKGHSAEVLYQQGNERYNLFNRNPTRRKTTMAQTVEQELVKATNVKPGKDRQRFLVALVEATAALENEKWKKLTKPTQAWFNDSAQPAYNAEKEIPEPPGSETPANGDANSKSGAKPPALPTQTEEDTTMNAKTTKKKTAKKAKTAAPKKSAAKKKVAKTAAPKKSAAKKARVPRKAGDGCPTIIRNAILDNPEHTVESLLALCVKKGRETNSQTVSALRSQFRGCVEVLRERGELKNKNLQV